MKNKRKGIVLAASILGSVAIVSTGFASWVITNSQSDSATGNITVDELNDNRVVVTAKWSEVDNVPVDTVKFASQTSNNQDNMWYTHSGEDGVMDLTLNLSVAYKDSTKTEKPSGTFKVSIEVGKGTANAFVADPSGFEAANKRADGKHYVTLPTFSTDGYTAANGTATVNVSFGWGDVFGNVDPLLYYNYLDANKVKQTTPQPYNDVVAEMAIDDQKALDALKAYTYKITVSFN